MLIRRSELRLILATTGIVVLGACSNAPTQPDIAADSDADNLQSTILLVSLDDGSIVRQTLGLDADICIKTLASPTTTCLTKGDAIVNDDGHIVGYEMLSAQIELRGLD